MAEYAATFIKTSHEVIEANGLETIKRWANDSNPTIAEMFKECLRAAGVPEHESRGY